MQLMQSVQSVQLVQLVQSVQSMHLFTFIANKQANSSESGFACLSVTELPVLISVSLYKAIFISLWGCTNVVRFRLLL
jgi:hypothetical protein